MSQVEIIRGAEEVMVGRALHCRSTVLMGFQGSIVIVKSFYDSCPFQMYYLI